MIVLVLGELTAFCIWGSIFDIMSCVGKSSLASLVATEGSACLESQPP